MALINGYDVASRERAYSGDPNDFENDRAFGREVGRTGIYQKYADEFERNPERDYALILEKARELNHDPEHITVSMFLRSLETLMLRAPAVDRWKPGTLKRKPIEPVPAEEETPQPHRGQLMWKEHHEFMEHGGVDGGFPSGDQVRAHARESKSFRAYLQQGYEARMSNEIGGAGVIVNAPVASSDSNRPSQELLQWVETYRVTPMEEVRKKMRADFNPGGFREYNRNFEAAVAAGLI